jgi:coenzyme F420 hydrogenase subunit beta
MADLEAKLFGRARGQEEVLGIYGKAASAQSIAKIGKAQDGGVVTALLVHALEKGLIDCAVVTDRDDEWRPVPRVAASAEEIVSAAGTKYTIANSVFAIREAMERGYAKIGFVGTPCQIQALRKVQLLGEPYELGQERIALLIGLFCMENFDYDSLMEGLVKGRFGLRPQDIARFEIQRGMFRAIDKKGAAYEVRIEETDAYTFKGCGPCFDFTAELADVSVGSVVSPAGWSTVLTRTPAGAGLYASALAAGALQETPVSERGLALARRLAAGKEQRFRECSQKMMVRDIKR